MIAGSRIIRAIARVAADAELGAQARRYLDRYFRGP